MHEVLSEFSQSVLPLPCYSDVNECGVKHMSSKVFPASPCTCMVFRAYRDREHFSTTAVTWWLSERVLLTVTPSRPILILSTRLIPGIVAGQTNCLLLYGWKTIISCDLTSFNLRLFSEAHRDMYLSSCGIK